MERNEVWSMDFVADELADGRRFRALTVIDLFTRECLDILAGRGLKSDDVVAVLERLRFERGLPKRLYCDNGSEFVSPTMHLWADSNELPWTSAGGASPPTMRRSHRSTADSGRSV